MKWMFLIIATFLGIAGTVRAEGVLPPVAERFAKLDGEELPSFQRHVLPLLGRLGCNGRACHGSFQGQGGFRLSLFGYDFKADYDALTAGEHPRVDTKDAASSLMVQKPTKVLSHKGGKLIEPGSWQHHLLQRWIQKGAVAVKESDASFSSLEIEPKEIVFGKERETVNLKVIAKWSDGSREDVTPLCRFLSNNDTLASVSPSGVVTSLGKGDTDIVAFYDNGVVTVPVIRPVSDRVGDRYPRVETPTKVDELAVARLKKLGIVPSDLCTDAEFLRRVSLDMTGTLPSSWEVSSFLTDSSPDKRKKKIDELLERPAYAAWWATRLGDFTGNTERNGPLGGEQGLNREKSRQWYIWLHRRIKDNVSYDKIVEGIVLAVGRKPEQSYEDYCKEMSAYFRKNDPADIAARETMPYYWTRRSVGKPEDKALSFAYAFLGVSLQCAQCHKHPYDQWTKQDFDQFSVFFNGIRYGGGGPKGVAQEMKKALGLGTLDEDSGNYKRIFVDALASGKVAPFKELSIPVNTAKKGKPVKPQAKLGRVITPKLLGGEEVIDREYDDPRRPLMNWLRDDDNPYFARAFVNRVWANYFNVGIINPPDDMNLANPPSNRELLDYLSNGFEKSGYDMKWLHREIANSRTYQLTWRPNETNRLDERNFSRAVLRRLPAEVVNDAIHLATTSDANRKSLDADPVTSRAIGVVSGYGGGRGNESAYAVTLFGKPPRAINCDCERSVEPSLLQTVYLRNDQEVLKLLEARDSWLKTTKERDPEKLIREAYLRTLSRQPDEREKGVAMRHVKDAGDVVSGMRDLLWALLNTKEFLVNR